MKRLLVLLFLSSLFVGCQKGDFGPLATEVPVLPSTLYKYTEMNPPAHMGFPHNTPPDNLMTDAGATLGRVLFYDKKLSLNNSVACGSCHHQANAFADPVDFSMGFRNKRTTRNSMAIINPGFQFDFFWDMRAQGLENQVIMPVQNHIEMGMERMEDMETKLAMQEYYPELFRAAFGTEEITQDRIQKAMAQFLRSMVSWDSKYDRGVAADFGNFTPLEKRGKELFLGWGQEAAGCVNCHSGPNLEGWGAANIGLDLKYSDNGVGDLHEGDHLAGMFRIPSLRNVALTGPYMHDGRYKTLEQVVDHYDDGVQSHPNLDYRLTEAGRGFFLIDFPPGPTLFPGGGFGQFQPNDRSPKKLNLSSFDKQALVAFMKTLSDDGFIRDEKYSNPFQLVN